MANPCVPSKARPGSEKPELTLLAHGFAVKRLASSHDFSKRIFEISGGHPLPHVIRDCNQAVVADIFAVGGGDRVIGVAHDEVDSGLVFCFVGYGAEDVTEGVEAETWSVEVGGVESFAEGFGDGVGGIAGEGSCEAAGEGVECF